MMSHPSLPDLIVGIDFGQTCTGVAYNLPALGTDTVQFIRSWPSRDGTTRNKVPTVLYYRRPHDTTPSSWGLLAEIDGEQESEGYTADWFKKLLDWRAFSSRQEDGYPITDLSYADITRWHVGFLRELYSFIQRTIHDVNPALNWDSAFVEFHFSTPTTWEPAIIQRFHKLAHEAGFGKCENHRHMTFLTEPEAVACHALREKGQIFQPNEVVLICDAGGGTTDLSAFRIESDGPERLEQIEPPDGDNIGSVLIDSAFERLALDWLAEADRQQPLFINSPEKDLTKCAWTMARDQDFQNAKCDFGSGTSSPVFSVPIKGLSPLYRMDKPRIAGGMMYFDHANTIFANLFDPVVNRLLGQIDKQFRSLGNETRISHLILSGGLGQSPYVKTRVREHCNNAISRFENIRGIDIRVAKEPQLAVCKGIVTNRLAAIHREHSIISHKCCQASYGIMFPVPYDETIHLNPNPSPVRDRHDQNLYLRQAVDWLIFKGRPISTDKPIQALYLHKVNPGKVPEFRFDIATSTAHRPPDQVRLRKDVLSNVRGILNAADWHRYVEEHPDMWRDGGTVVLELRVLLGSTDLRFELWFDNKKISRDNPIDVTWEPDQDAILPETQLQNLNATSRLQRDSYITHARRPAENKPADEKDEDDDDCCCCCCCM